MIRFTKPCDKCEGTGKWKFGATEQAQYLAGQMPCPSCVGGWLPDDDTVEAGGLAMLHAGGHFKESPNQAFFDDFRAGLVAAARYQKRSHETGTQSV